MQNTDSDFRRWMAGDRAAWGRMMASAAQVPTFPGGSKQRVTKAGEAVRSKLMTPEDLECIDEWRAAHRAVLNTFQAILRNRTRGTSIIIAQRHKRRSTIFDKLDRFPSMQLARMDDVAGCRLIFDTIDQLYEFRKSLHAAHFNHKLRNDPNKYDYISSPKTTGYRGIHDVFIYDVNSTHGRAYKGLLIELQYRTFAQHAWATAVEVVGFVTASQPKFQQGDKRFEIALAWASEIIARAHEGLKSCFPDHSDADVVSTFLELESEIGLLRMLRALHSAEADVSEHRNVILIFSDGPDGRTDLQTRAYRDAPEALRALFRLERENPGKDIVLVRGDTTDDVRVAFKNYFTDAREFLRLIDEGVTKLAGDRVQYGPIRRRARGSGADKLRVRPAGSSSATKPA